jgi:hypothetical protein
MLDLRFRDHGAFQIQVLRAAGVFAAGMAVATVAERLGLPMPPPALALGAAGVALLWALAPPGTWRAWLVAAAVAGLATTCGILVLPRDPMLAAGLYGIGLGLYAGKEMDGWGRLAAIAAVGLAVPLGLSVADTLVHLGIQQLGHPVIGHSLVGGGFGFVAGTVSALGQHISWCRDAVARAYAAGRGRLHGDLAEVVDRAMESRRRVLVALVRRRADTERTPGSGGGEEFGRKLLTQVNQLTLRILGIADRLAEPADARGADALELLRRRDDLERKHAAADDAVARAHYGAAQRALDQQLAQLEEIRTSRERALARLANHSATLERLHLAVTQHRFAASERFAAELGPLTEQLANAGGELACDAQGIQESTAAAEPATP